MNSKTIYAIGSNINLYHTESLQWLIERQEKSIDLIFLDPPYFLTNNPKSQSFKGEWDLSKGTNEDFNFFYRILTQCKRVLKDDGTIWITGTHHNIFMCGYALQLLDYKILNIVNWYKPRKKWANTTDVLAYDSEQVIFARKDKRVKHFFNLDYAKIKADKFHAEGGTMPTTWDIYPASFKEVEGHPTPKPVELLIRIINLTTKEGAVILDPFNGSGTSAIATLDCGQGRKYIGLDMNNQYLDLTLERINKKYPNQGARQQKMTSTDHS